MKRAALAAVALVASVASAADYRWPLELPPELTSSFGEYRARRYHAGIDLRTGGIGLPVYAAADGHLSRVRCSPWGYGKAVYLQMDDGNSAVYAHLDDFPDDVRAYVRREQHAQRRYEVDLYPAAGQFRVKRGELIAYSGDTGIGAPHLHYELRDANARPFNPREANVNWPDTTAPTIEQVMLVPRGPGDLIENDILPRTLDLPSEGGKRMTSPIRAWGSIGIAINAHDRGASGSYRLDPYRMRVFAGEAEVFSVQRDRIDYDTNNDGWVAYHPFFLDEGRYHVLWRWPGNDSPPYAHTRGDGWWNVPPGSTELRIEAEDFQGNRTTVHVPIIGEAPAEPAAPSPTGTGRGTGEMECYGEYLVFTARFDAAEPEAPVLTYEALGAIEAVPLRRIDATTYRTGFAPARSGRFDFRLDHPRLPPFHREVGAFVRGDAATLTLDGLEVSVPAEAPYGTLYIRAYRFAPKAPAGLTPLGEAWRLWPEAMPLDADITLRFPAPAGVPTAQVFPYRQSGSGWDRISAEPRGTTLAAEIGQLGTYQLMQDNSAPTLEVLSPPDGYTAETARPIIKARMRDAGSGLKDYEVLLGEQWLLCAFDPDTSQVIWERDEDLPRGTHTLRFRASDAAGNTRTAERTITLP